MRRHAPQRVLDYEAKCPKGHTFLEHYDQKNKLDILFFVFHLVEVSCLEWCSRFCWKYVSDNNVRSVLYDIFIEKKPKEIMINKRKHKLQTFPNLLPFFIYANRLTPF